MKDLNYKNIRIFISEKQDGSMKLLGGFDDDKIIENRKNFLIKSRIKFENVVSADLIHGSSVAIVDKSKRGEFIEKTDGLVTKKIFF